MEKMILNYIKQHNMIKQGNLVVAGVSGGADSMCMLALLLRFQKQLDFELLVVHVHHGIRGEQADRDEAHVKRFCEAQGVRFCGVHVNVPELAKTKRLSLEEAGRLARREAFVQAAESYLSERGMPEEAYCIALAHHQQDVAETVLFHLARGSGIRGAAGMHPVNGKYIRPLLCARREQIEAWLDSRQISYVEDSTNQELEYTRNRIRNVTLPYLQEHVNAGVVGNLYHFATVMQDTLAYLEQQLEKARPYCVVQYHQVWKLTKKAQELEPILRNMLLQQQLSECLGGAKDISNVQLQQVQELFEAPSGTTCRLMGGLEAKKGYTGVYLYPAGVDLYAIEEILRDEAGSIPLDCQEQIRFQVLPYDEKVKNLLNDYTKYFDYDKIKGDLCTRTKMPGDYLILSRDGGKKTLKSYLIDQKVPRELRNRLTVVAAGSHVLWVVGMRDSAGCRVTEETTRVLRVWLEMEEYKKDEYTV